MAKPDIEQLKSTVGATLWETDLDTLSWQRAGAIQVVRFFYVMGRDIADGQLNLRAMSLVFTTLLSLVPLLAISFSVLKGFGIHNEIEPILMNLLAPLGEKGSEIALRIIGFVENIKVGVLGSVGLGLLVYTVMSLMQKIERAFNFAWRVNTARSFSQRFSGYLSVLMVGPLLIFSSLGITATMTASPLVLALTEIQPFGWMIALAGKLVPYFMVVCAFTFIYVFMPNTRVRVGSALVGALVSGLLWEGMGWGFTTFILSSTKYTAIYSAFATPVLFMIWLHLSWLVLLIGAAIAFYHQHPEFLTPLRGALRLSNRMKEKIALMAMALIGRRYYDGGPGWNGHALAQYLRVPVIAMDTVLNVLEAGGFLKQTDDEPPLYLPARPLETTSVAELLDAMATAGERQPYLTYGRIPPDGTVDHLLAEVDQARSGVANGVMLKDLIDVTVEPIDTKIAAVQAE